MKRETLFIKADKIYYLPRPTSWLGGWARNLWFDRAMKSKSKIASPGVWNTLCEERAEFDGAGTYLTWPPTEELKD
mgnify:CR=1 FL=1